MSYVTVAELRDALGIGALYDDDTVQSCIDAAEEIIIPMLTFQEDWTGVQSVHQALLMTGADIWQARTASNGQGVGVDFAPAPFRMGHSLLTRVKGLLAPYISVGSMIG